MFVTWKCVFISYLLASHSPILLLKFPSKSYPVTNSIVMLCDLILDDSDECLYGAGGGQNIQIVTTIDGLTGLK